MPLLAMLLVLAVPAGAAYFLYTHNITVKTMIGEEVTTKADDIADVENASGLLKNDDHAETGFQVTVDEINDIETGSELENAVEAASDSVQGEPGQEEPTYSADAPDTLPLTTADPDVIRIAFAGDILFDESYAIMASLLQRSGGAPDIHRAFDEEMLSLMRGADLFMVNNEFPYSSRGAALENKQFTFRARPQYASLLHDMGADIVGLANNHVNDYGREAMLDTFDTLDDIGMPYVGAGRNLAEASRIQYYTNGDVKIGIVAATQIERMGNPDTVGATDSMPGVFRCMNPTALIEKIKETKENCDCCIVFVHWGTEGTPHTDDWQEKQAVQFAEAGADLIIGDHPHVLQKIAAVRGVPVVFSLGNYLFNSKTLDTGLVEVTLDAHNGAYTGMRFIPALQSGCRTVRLTGTEKERVLQELRDLSPGTSIDAEGYIDFAGSR